MKATIASAQQLPRTASPTPSAVSGPLRPNVLPLPFLFASFLILTTPSLLASAQKLDSGEWCWSDFECRNFACALDSATSSSTTQRICCPADDYVFVGPPINANVCTFQPDGSPCLDNRDELCESFVCIDGTCQPRKVDVGERCDSDSDCRNWSCGKERTEAECIQFCDDVLEPDDVPSICCPSGEAIDLGDPWGMVCTGQADGMPCRGEDRLCGETGSICQWNSLCEQPLGRYQDMELTAPTRFLSIGEFVKLQQTETDREYQYKEEREGEDADAPRKRRRAQEVWNDASKFELIRSIRHERRGGGKFPFLLCVSSDAVPETVEADTPTLQTGSEAVFDREDNLPASGFKKKRELFGAVLQAEAENGADYGDEQSTSTFARPESADSSGSSDGTIEIGGVPITPLYNDGNLYCGHTLMYGSIARKISCDGCIVQPLLQSMKMGPETVALAEGLMDTAIADYLDEDDVGMAADSRANKELKDFPSLEVVSCAGVRTKDEFEALKSLDAEGTGVIDTTEGANYLLTFLTGWGAEVAMRAIAEEVYWAQEDAQSVVDYDEDRGYAWYSILNYTVAETRCREFYQEKLIWRTAIGKDEKDFTYNRVYWNNTEVSEEDQYCILGFLVVVAVDATVCHMEITPATSVSNPTAAWLTQTGLENEMPWTDLGLDGAGQVVAVSDTGIDRDNCYFWDSVSDVGPNHRKIVSYNAYADDSDEEWGHGTHTSCTIAGKRATNGIQESSGAADGIAPKSRISFLDIGTASGSLTTPSDNELLSTGRPEAKIHSASWGAHAINYYSSQAKNFDTFLYDNDDFLMIMAAGNDGAGDAPSSVDVPANAKNVIAVGASSSYGKDLEKGQLGPAHIAGFSSRGPTADGRMKPDIVAPGKFVLSAGARPGQVGECDGGNIPAANGRSDGLLSMQGTSMAAPVVSGNAALIHQYFNEGWHGTGERNSAASVNPSGALVKAVLMNGAQPVMKGVDNGPDGISPTVEYDNNQGFGIVSLTHSLHIAGKSDVQLKFWDREVISDGSTLTYPVTIDRSRGCNFPDLSATLVWFEKGAAMGCTRCVINDLDLYVTRDGDESQTRYYPNGLEQEDSINTIERVVLNNVMDGESLTLHVRATNLDESTQKFALVSTGCFGGVANTLDTNDNVFAADMSTPFSGGGGEGARALSNGAIIGISVGIAALLLLLVAGVFILRSRRHKVVSSGKEFQDRDGASRQEEGYPQRGYDDSGEYQNDGINNREGIGPEGSYQEGYQNDGGAYHDDMGYEDDGYDHSGGGYEDDDAYGGYDEEEDMPANYQ
eukprot:CAMPEP_0178474814 /NCGR_PEP_ID=MMETSP0696-20121128/2794_1 /TAXON_ID=265572 /ORGANISM="Extubocellulus spinifer, Strain CCMP396" /LENGTH=1296 /DNA_ID=CAMNT_0020102075 /DNA_START=71 /DNA_END=3961 /DNA_ORIENTATION=-